MGEITVILLLALIFLGPKKLPELASGLGKLIREIRKTTADVKNEIQLDLVLDVRGGFSNFPDKFSQRRGQLGQLLWTKEDQGQKQDDRDLSHAEVEHDLVFNSDRR